MDNAGDVVRGSMHNGQSNGCEGTSFSLGRNEYSLPGITNPNRRKTEELQTATLHIMPYAHAGKTQHGR